MVGPLVYLLCIMAVVLVITAIPFIFAIIGMAIAAIAKWKVVKHIADRTADTLNSTDSSLENATTDELVDELMKRGKVKKGDKK